MSTVREITPPDTARGFAAMRVLRPQLTDAAAFVDQVDEVQRAQGYRLVGAFEDDDEDAVAVAGFREITNLAWGRHMYIDDLSTLPAARGRGHGRALLDWVDAVAEAAGMPLVDLDSGVGENRQAAHRLYFNAGYRISSYHFNKHVG